MSEGDRLTPELQSLLAAERDAPGPDAGTRDRVARKLASTLGVTLAAAGASGAATSGAQAALPKALLGKSIAGKLLVAAIVGGVAVGGVVTTVTLVHRHAQRPPTHAPAIAPPPSTPRVAPIAAPPVAATPATDTPSLGAVTPATAEPSSPSLLSPSPSLRSHRADVHRGEAHHADAVRAAGRPDLAAERALLTDARAAMQAADAPHALAILDDHERRFARGQLAEERDALRVAALWLDGDHAGARRQADSFARRHPDSLFLPSVQRAVQPE